jgi:hypothetical protein
MDLIGAKVRGIVFEHDLALDQHRDPREKGMADVPAERLEIVKPEIDTGFKRQRLG